MDEPKEVRYASGGVELFARMAGAGQPIVLLHGSGLTTSSSLAGLAHELAANCHHQVITCDVRGFGNSVSRDPASHTWRQYALDVVALLDHLNIPSAVVGGFSFGAAIAVVTALQHPERVVALVLAEPGFAGAEIGLSAAQEQLWARSRELLETAREQGLKASLVAGAQSQEEAAAVGAAVGEHDEPSFLAAHEGELQTTQPFAALNSLEAVMVPTLLLPGTDAVHSSEIASWYARHLPRATVGPPASAPPPVLAAAIDALLAEDVH